MPYNRLFLRDEVTEKQKVDKRGIKKACCVEFNFHTARFSSNY